MQERFGVNVYLVKANWYTPTRSPMSFFSVSFRLAEVFRVDGGLNPIIMNLGFVIIIIIIIMLGVAATRYGVLAQLGSSFSLYKILFHFKTVVWESIILVLPPHLQSLPYCNTIAGPLRNIRPPTDPPFIMPFTIQYW